MSGYRDQALEKLRKEAAAVTGTKEKVMAPAVRAALENFVGQDEEFAQAIVQGGTFSDCMKKVAAGVGTSISDLDAYRRAVQFYFPGAEVRMQMTIDLIGEAAQEKEQEPEKPAGILLDFTQFL